MVTILLLFALNPEVHSVTESVDRVEVNAVFTADGEHVFDQVIFRDANYETGELDVVAWRLLKGVRLECQATEKAWKACHCEPYVPRWIGGHAEPRRVGNHWECVWYDETNRKHRRVIAASRAIVESAYDREMKERDRLPQERRKGLR